MNNRAEDGCGEENRIEALNLEGERQTSALGAFPGTRQRGWKEVLVGKDKDEQGGETRGEMSKEERHPSDACTDATKKRDGGDDDGLRSVASKSQ